MNRTREMDTEAWLGEVLQRYEQSLVGYALRLTRDLEAARDLAQDTFLELVRRPISLDDPRLGPWLFRVCRNRAIDRLRKERRMHVLDEPEEQALPPGRPSPLQAAEQRESEGRLVALLRRLPPRQQEVVWLRFRSGLSYREIAEITRTSVGNVGFVLHEAMRTLRERLGEASVASPSGEPS